MRILIALVLSSLALAVPGTASAVAWGSSMDGGNGTPGLPTCNHITNGMHAYANGRWYTCYYWPAWGFGEWL